MKKNILNPDVIKIKKTLTTNIANSFNRSFLVTRNRSNKKTLDDYIKENIDVFIRLRDK